MQCSTCTSETKVKQNETLSINFFDPTKCFFLQQVKVFDVGIKDCNPNFMILLPQVKLLILHNCHYTEEFSFVKYMQSVQKIILVTPHDRLSYTKDFKIYNKQGEMISIEEILEFEDYVTKYLKNE